MGIVYENFKDESHHLDPTYGYFRFLEHEWGYDESGERWEIFEYLETEPCTRTRLGLEVDEAEEYSSFNFWHTVDDRQYKEISKYADDFWCLQDPTKLKV